MKLTAKPATIKTVVQPASEYMKPDPAAKLERSPGPRKKFTRQQQAAMYHSRQRRRFGEWF